MAKRQNKTVPESTLAEGKLFTNLLRTIRQYTQGRNYSPLSFKEIMDKLSLPEQHSAITKEVLKALTKEGSIKFSKGKYQNLINTENIMTGIISMHSRGFGFVKTDLTTDEEDIFIPKHLTLNAVDGDHVEVAINREWVSEKGPEGKVVAILSRSRTHIAGIITFVSFYGEISAYAPLLGISQNISVVPSEQFLLREGDRVVMKVLDWGSADSDLKCTVSHHLGHINNPSCDIEAAIEEYELLSEFSSKSLQEAATFGKQVKKSDLEGRKDFRLLECFTIDPKTAKDFDDALTITKDSQGHFHLIVHIADVSHYVKEGSVIDVEAVKRCNSTYFPGTCLPMLPKDLSENLCSLKPNVNRLAVSVAMKFDADGTMYHYEIFKSVIKSKQRFTYEEVKEILDGRKKSKHTPSLQLMVELCNLLKRKRFERGSLEFALPELIIKIDEQGVPYGTEYVHYDITHQMVEEFMLKANETVAHHLDKQGKHLAFRIHEEPSEENLKDFSLLANAFGFSLPAIPTAQDLQKLFDEALETSYGQYLAISYIRRMRQALYSPDNIGHYGLGLTHYCHFTSPIRRYVDLVIHRSLFKEALDLKNLAQIAKGCSEQERISAKAENQVLLLKKLRLLETIHKENPFKCHEAVITRVKNFGFSFEILEFLLDGFIHVSQLDDDFFIYDEKKLQLFGRHTSKVYSSGERIYVMLKEVNLILLESKWEIVIDDFPTKNSQKKKSVRKKGSRRESRKESKKEPLIENHLEKKKGKKESKKENPKDKETPKSDKTAKKGKKKL